MTVDHEDIKISLSPEHFLLQIEPLKDKSVAFLRSWIKKSQKFIKENMDLYGGIYFKDFDINSAADFESLALEIDPNLNETHPFNCSNRTWHTQFTCETASPCIKQSLTPKGLHNEDSYVSYVPKIVMFFPLEAAVEGGETLVADCRKVYQKLPKKLQEKLLGKTMINKLIMHDDILLVNNQIPKSFEAIKQLGEQQNSKETLRISENLSEFSFEIPVIIKHESSKDPIWFNLLHIAPYLGYNVLIDTWCAYKHKGGLLNKIKAISIIGVTFLKDIKFLIKSLMNKSPENQKFLSEVGNYYISDGSKISFLDRICINLAIWKSTSILPLNAGDMVALDNRLVSHGRMPFKGRRTFLTAMGSRTIAEIFTI
jgi:alpha-ketoglutarate-dependent taurine dioxygenase